MRYGVNITYAVAGCARRRTSTSRCPARSPATLPEPLLRLMGYARGAYALGYVDDLRDPLDALRGGGPGTSFGDLEAVRAQLRKRA